jgi:hypothetical protein
MELHPKFIIEDGNLIIGKVEYHRDLATDKKNVRGGGLFRVKNNSFIFYSTSYEFGEATLTDIRNAVVNKKVYTNKYLTLQISDKHLFAYDDNGEIKPLNY